MVFGSQVQMTNRADGNGGMEIKMKKLIQLFLMFLKIGAFTFGGGYAMIALLENEFIEKKKWIDREEFLNMVAIAESTPGPVAINSATYIGYRVGGAAGAALSTLAVSIPSFVIIYLISLFFDKFLSLTYVAYAFKGIQVCVVYLIASAGVRMFKGLEKNVFNYCVLGLVIIVMTVFSITAVSFSSIFYIVISGVAGWAVYMLGKCVGNSGKKCSDTEGKHKK
jgi:chromate transporter